MTQAVAGEMCRLVVCGPTRQVDVAVPAHVVVADLMPVLLHHLGEELADTGLVRNGWVLQRLGEAPFDEESTVAGLGLHDGDAVHLRPRAEQIPPVDFDDLIDGVATGLRQRAGQWRPSMIAWVATGVLVVALAAGAGSLLLPGPPLLRMYACLGMVLVCLLAGFGMARAFGERAFGVAIALGAVGHAAVAGLLAPELGSSTGAIRFTAPELFAASVAVVATALIAMQLMGHARPWFVALVAGATLASLASGIATYAPVGAAGAVSLVAVVGTVASTLVPTTAFKLAGLRLPPLPTEPQHIQEDIDPEPSEPLLARAAAADRYMTALYGGAAVTVGVALVWLALMPGWAPATLVLLVCGKRLLQARPMTSAWHRLASAAPAVAGLTAEALATVAGLSYPARVAFPLVVVPLIAVQSVILARMWRNRRPMPYWGRVGDLTQTVFTVALVPVHLAVLGVYDYARSLGG